MRKSNHAHVLEYINTRGLSKNTEKSLNVIIENYTNFQGKSMQELLDEAESDEENRVRWKNRTLRARLINYMNYTKSRMSATSAKHYVKVIKSFYRHNDIEIGYLPNFNLRNSKPAEPIQYHQLPDKTVIRRSIEISTPVMKSLILYLSSSGVSRVDALKLNINDFLEATYEYHEETRISSVLEILNTLNRQIIPTWRSRRQKTNKYYITFNTNEASKQIITYLIQRDKKKPLRPEDKLFKINDEYCGRKFAQINKALKLGKVGSFNRFRGHMLRKFHASALERAGMNRAMINVMQGKSNGNVDDVYFITDEKKLKEDFLLYQHALIITEDTTVINEYSQEYIDLKKQNDEFREKMLELEVIKNDLEKIKEWYPFG